MELWCGTPKSGRGCHDPRSSGVIKICGIDHDKAAVGMIALEEKASSLRDLIDLGHLLRAQRPADRFHVLLDLFDTRRAGDDA